jgi:hypothetical protein
LLADQPFGQVALPVGLAVEAKVVWLVHPVRDDRDDSRAVERIEQPGS